MVQVRIPTARRVRRFCPVVLALVVAQVGIAWLAGLGIEDSIGFHSPLLEHPRCAICFYGLPRSFAHLVLPSIRENVLKYNQRCDYFVHYYQVTQEQGGRSGTGGVLDPTEIEQLRQFVPRIQIVSETDTDFWQARGPLLEHIRSARAKRSFVKSSRPKNLTNLLYFPVKDLSTHYPTTMDNIVKMWHSQQAVWNLMERHWTYDQVAMLRSDVVFTTPITVMSENQTVVVPGFAQYPVNDRMVYGPREAVRVWASQRFDLLDEHIARIQKEEPGWGMHSERVLHYTIFPKIRSMGYVIYEDPEICFLRARTDHSVWLNDCGRDNLTQRRQTVEQLVQHPCRQSWLEQSIKKRVIQLECDGNNRFLPDDMVTHRPE